jgi:hypothetical protein
MQSRRHKKLPKEFRMSDQSSKGGGEKPPSNKRPPSELVPGPSPQEIIPATLDSVLRKVGIDPTDPNVSKALEISLTMMFSGSLPIAPPPILREYGNIRPELIDKLIEWTDLQSNHRRDLERIRTEGSEKRLNRAQGIGATIALGGLCLAALVGTFGNMWAAIIIAIVAVGGPTAAIWLAQNVRKQPPQLPTQPAQPASPTPQSPAVMF